MAGKTDERASDEKVVEIEMERLRAFENHPFKVIADSQMIELQESIKKYGVLTPLIVRCRTDFADIQNKKECGGNRQWQNHYLRNWAANTKGKGII